MKGFISYLIENSYILYVFFSENFFSFTEKKIKMHLIMVRMLINLTKKKEYIIVNNYLIKTSIIKYYI